MSRRPCLSLREQLHRLQSAAAGLDYSPREANFTLALATLTARLKRRSLIVLFSDFADPTSAELMVESVERLHEDLYDCGIVAGPLKVIIEIGEPMVSPARTPERNCTVSRSICIRRPRPYPC